MQPVYDIWSAFFLLSATAGVISSLIILYHFRSQKSAIWISSLTLLFSFTIADWLIFWTHNQPAVPHLFLITFFFNFLYGPLFYFYIKELAGDRLNKFQRLVHFLPFLTTVLLSTPLLLSTAEQKIEIMLHGYQNRLSFYKPFFSFASWFSVSLMILYSFLALKLAIRFSLFKTVHKWAVTTIFSYCIFSLNFLAYEILSKMPFFNPLWDYGIAASMILMIFVLIISAYVQPQIFNGFTMKQSIVGMAQDADTSHKYDTESENSMSVINSELNGEYQQNRNNKNLSFPDGTNHYAEITALNNQKISAYKAQGQTSAESVELIDRLNDLMINEKLYTLYDLRLDTIAERLYVSRKKVSQLINEKFQMNFFDYINTMRIEEAKHLLETNYQLSVKEIMYTVGFNNKVSFYKAFKNKTGLTPTDFKQKLLERDKNEAV